MDKEGGRLMGVCTECGRARLVWPELVHGVAECRCGSNSFTIAIEEEEAEATADEEDHSEGLRPL